jgi:predicted amidohydrolase YtcJ
MFRRHEFSIGSSRTPRRVPPIDGGFLLPGLTDAHTHPGRPAVLGAPLADAKLRADARARRPASR